jgi:hypothetical protein
MWQGSHQAKNPGVIQVPRLEPKDLYDRRVRRDFARLKAYNQLLEQIYHKIYRTSQLPGTQSSITFSIPPFILGLPKLDMEDCVVYIVWQLRDAKFEVRFTYPNLLWISWAAHEAEYFAKQNPIVQAMIPEPPPTPAATNVRARGGKKGGAGGGGGVAPTPAPPSRPTVAFNQEIDIITSTAPQGAQFGMTPRNPSDYLPPSSFLDAMDRPTKQNQGAQQNSQAAKQNILADLWTLR